MSEHVVIVGGGVIGSAIACFLAQQSRFSGRISVIERDPGYQRASSALSASSIRQQFSSPINIAISQFGITFLREAAHHLHVTGHEVDLGLSEHGYLYLATTAGARTLRENHEVQHAQGVQVALLEPAALVERFPWLNVDDLALGSLGLAGEGWFDGYALLMAFRRKARSLGVHYLHAEADGIVLDGERVRAVRLRDGSELACSWAVNAGGAWAAALHDPTGFALPVRGRTRTVFAFSSPASTPACPLLIDPSGLWLRPEGKLWICGLPPEPDPDDAPLEVDYGLYDRAWELLAHRVPGFEAIRLQRAWCGYYEYNLFDQNGLVGPHPYLPNLLLANGFSGHGLQQAPAVGRGLAEWIAEGRYTTLDLSALSPRRVLDRMPLIERNVI